MSEDIKKDLTILVPAGGILENAFDYKSYKSSTEDPSFLNMGNSLAIKEIKEKYDYKLFLAVQKSSKKFLKLIPFEGIQIFEVGLTNSITDTLYKSLENIKSKWCLINPITTLPDTDFVDTPFIEFGSKLIPKGNWSSLVFNKEKNPFFIDKSANNYIGILSHPFTGRILAKTEDIISVINNLGQTEKNDCIHIAIKLFKEAKVNIRYCKNWLDIKHQANNPLLKKSTITSRFFNSVTFDEVKKVPILDEYIVSTDDPEIEIISKNYGVNVPFGTVTDTLSPIISPLILGGLRVFKTEKVQVVSLAPRTSLNG